MGVKLANNVSSVLVSELSRTDTTIRVKVGHGSRFPELIEADDWFPVGIANDLGQIEYMRAKSRVGDMIIVARAQEGSEALNFVAGSHVFLPLTVAALKEAEEQGGPLSLIINSMVVVV